VLSPLVQADEPVPTPALQRFAAPEMTVAGGRVVLIGSDRADLACFTHSETPTAPDDALGLEPIQGVTAGSDLSITLDIASPTQVAPNAQWTFKIRHSWKDAQAISVPWTTNIQGVTATVGPGSLAYTGSMELVYTTLADLRTESRDAEERGVMTQRPVFFFNEERFPMRCEEIPTAVQGLRIRKIAYARSEGKTRSLVIVEADSVDTLSRQVRVSSRNPKFEWSPRWFYTVGAPVREPQK
jgi:hypothetical protein